MGEWVCLALSVSTACFLNHSLNASVISSALSSETMLWATTKDISKQQSAQNALMSRCNVRKWRPERCSSSPSFFWGLTRVT